MKKITAHTFVGFFGQMASAFALECTPEAAALTSQDFTLHGNYRQTIGKVRSDGVLKVSIENGTLMICVDPFLFSADFKVECTNPQYSFDRSMISDVKTEIADEFSAHLEDGVRYRLYTPEGDGLHPLVLFLHGGGEGGDDNNRHIVGTYAATAWVQRFPDAYVFAPQAPRNENTLKSIIVEPHETVDGDPFTALLSSNFRSFRRPACRDRGDWTRQYLHKVCQIIRKMIEDKKVDPNRVYVTGLSMGGAGTIRALCVDRTLFTAALPVCPMTSEDTFNELKSVGKSKIWIATSYLDNLFERNKYLLDGVMALQDEGSRNAHITIYSRQEIQSYNIGMEPGTTLAEQLMMNHGAAWILTYNNEYGLMDWLMSQTKCE